MVQAADTERTAEASAGADEALLRAYGAGDPGAAQAIAERYGPTAFRFALRLTSSRADAEDVAQEAMIRLYRAAPGWRPEGGQVTSWLYRVIANLATDLARRRPAEPIEAALVLADGTPGAEARLMARDREDALSRALAQLPDRQRLAVVLRHIEGLTNPEIAAIMEIGTEAVESLTARGKRALTEALAGERQALGYAEG
ncbi:sigma-70 family RNA polymerase sigma factor [Frigidibacter sp. RF13]|uniref:sigma-70 family RNA polymerase sigma factor n=1 Tax=Frigidibacter sp. RF13 TaxID=2997340 RepID=UPI002271AC37|nr:sigma-70 family RNA polymerase sigma factor [Frigidibacter sp. RF13]MCY1126323.1 sigma-70 family RNA polymerase sigma factor [Frigidibacter sp. RF13]